jgi:gluconate 2-dehydrogenase gamma chain
VTGVPVPEPRRRPRVSRRWFLTASGTAAAAGLVGACGRDGDAGGERSQEPPPPPDVSCATGFFTPHEARTVDALVGRIMPGDAADPGAREAGVVNYIDCLLAVGGFAEPVYLQPPFPAPRDEDEEPVLRPEGLDLDDLPPLVVTGDPAQGSGEGVTSGDRPSTGDQRDSSIESSSYGVIPIPKRAFDRYGWQSALDPPQLYRRGLRALDELSRREAGDDFAALDEDQQDVIVALLADGEATGFGTLPTGEAFFVLVRRHLIEGMFGDPIYGGNRDFAGWRLIGYPGAYRAWTPDELLEEGHRRPPQSIADLHRFEPGEADRGEARLPVAGGGAPHDHGWGPSTVDD